MFEKLCDQLLSIVATPLGLLVSACVSVSASSDRSPLIAFWEGSAEPLAAPVLTPMFSMLDIACGRPDPELYIAWRMLLSRSRRSGSPISVPTVGSVFEGCVESWVWICEMTWL